MHFRIIYHRPTRHETYCAGGSFVNRLENPVRVGQKRQQQATGSRYRSETAGFLRNRKDLIRTGVPMRMTEMVELPDGERVRLLAQLIHLDPVEQDQQVVSRFQFRGCCNYSLTHRRCFPCVRNDEVFPPILLENNTTVPFFSIAKQYDVTQSPSNEWTFERLVAQASQSNMTDGNQKHRPMCQRSIILNESFSVSTLQRYFISAKPFFAHPRLPDSVSASLASSPESGF